VPHSLATVRAIHDRYPELTFDITTKIEHIHEHAGVFDELRGCGLLFVVSAVESLDDSVLRILDKGHTAADAVEAVRRLRDGGIELRPSFLPFTPWGGLRSYLDLLDMVVEEDLVGSVDPVQLSIRLLLPVGSLLLAHPQMRPHLDGYNAAALTWRWRHPDPAMDRLQRRVAALVAADADAVVEPRTTHHRIRHQAAAAAAAAGITWTAAGPALAPAGPSRPRLSEAWFC